MMFPSIAPMVLMYIRIQAGKRANGQDRPLGGTVLFVAGYLLAWSAAGLVGYALMWAGHEVSPAIRGWDEGGRYVLAAVILAGALYEVTQ